MRIIGLGFQSGEAENSVVNDSLFMAQVTPRPSAKRQLACWLGTPLGGAIPACKLAGIAGLLCCATVTVGTMYQELCEGGSLRDHVMLQMNRYNKVGAVRHVSDTSTAVSNTHDHDIG